MKKRNVIAIGCFYKVEVAPDEGQEAPAYELLMIGTIYSRVEEENSRNEALLSSIDAPRWNHQTWF